jgi:hypothetical protein
MEDHSAHRARSEGSGRAPRPPGRLLPTAALLICAVLLAKPWVRQARNLGAGFEANLESLCTVAPEQRKRLAYGDRTDLGYGYVEEIVAGLPDPEHFPVTRYRDFTRNLHLLLPGHRRRIDSRMLIGIDLTDSDLREQTIAAARPLAGAISGAGQAASIWTFQTGDDFDTLTGIRLRFARTERGLSPALQIRLLASPRRPDILGAWSAPPGTPDAQGWWTVPLRLQPFSFGRGRTDFALEIEAATDDGVPPKIEAVEIRGVKVDLADYRVVHRDGGCWTALRSDFLEELHASGRSDWQQYLRNLAQVHGQVAVR